MMRHDDSHAALVLLAVVGPIEGFADQKQLYSYAGPRPRLRQSAEWKRSGGIPRAGSPRLRWILVEAATVAARCSPAAQRYDQHLAERKHRNLAKLIGNQPNSLLPRGAQRKAVNFARSFPLDKQTAAGL